MFYTDIPDILAEAGVPVTYYQFPEKEAPNPPYIIWYLPNSDNFGADDSVYQRIDNLNIELYTGRKDFALEAAVEAILDKYELVWEKSESYLNSERMYEVLYETQIVIRPTN